MRSERAGGETKTKRSRRTLELPALCVDALREHRQRQLAQRIRMGQRWVDNDLVFATRYGTEFEAANLRRAFWTVAAEAGPGGFAMDAPASCGTVLSALQFGRADRGQCAPSGSCQHECH